MEWAHFDETFQDSSNRKRWGKQFPSEVDKNKVLKQLFYISRATNYRGHISDLDILRHAQIKNKKDDVTGCLLRSELYFAQLIEGPTGAIDHLFKRIICDNRHFDISRKSERAISHRDFSDWGMGYAQVHSAAIAELIDMKDNNKLCWDDTLTIFRNVA